MPEHVEAFDAHAMLDQASESTRGCPDEWVVVQFQLTSRRLMSKPQSLSLRDPCSKEAIVHIDGKLGGLTESFDRIAVLHQIGSCR